MATLIGFGTAYLAANYNHPHTFGLSEHAQLVLDQHDFTQSGRCTWEP
ncbi:hypothetical protein [Pontibacter rugosus]